MTRLRWGDAPHPAWPLLRDTAWFVIGCVSIAAAALGILFVGFVVFGV